MEVTTLENSCSCLLFFFCFEQVYHRGMIGNNNGKVLFSFPFFILVPISLSYEYFSCLLYFCCCACSGQVTGDSSEREL